MVDISIASKIKACTDILISNVREHFHLLLEKKIKKAKLILSN
jgi:hypothetical protein